MVQDFISDKLKHKKHWNSFTTPFFLELSVVIEELQYKGQLGIDIQQAERWEKEDLRCNRCNSLQRNMPELKRHIIACNF